MELRPCAPVPRAQVSTGDGWAVHIARPLIGNAELLPAHGNGSAVLAGDEQGRRLLAADDPEAAPSIHRSVALFFVGFFFVCGIGLLGIVHAVSPAPPPRLPPRVHGSRCAGVGSIP